MEKLTYSVKEVAGLLGIGISATYQLVRSKDFPRIQVGKRIVIPKKAFEQWVDRISISGYSVAANDDASPYWKEVQ